MNSLVYFYSKFTEEFLLLGAAGVFTLLSIYCYHWVIQKRRLGVARSQIPSTVVKSYLSQLINEAEFVRKQLFGMTDGHTYVPTTGFSEGGALFTSPASEGNQSISPDLLARVNALEYQLKEKEGLVVNINIEKIKLLEEIEKLKANPSAISNSSSGNQDQLTQKVKNLEARLEEYSLFEEDLANLKRLQQENTQLKKRLSEQGASPAAPVERKTLTAVPDLQPVPEVVAPKETPKHALDQDAIDSLLNGTSATPPVETVTPEPTLAAAESVAEAVAEAAPLVAPPADQFENLVDSVENSLELQPVETIASAEPTAPVAAAAEVPTAAPVEAAAPTTPGDSSLANKTDEELLKEFENLLNS